MARAADRDRGGKGATGVGIWRFLPPIAILLPALLISALLAAAGQTLAYDFHAYVGAARRVLEGGQLYDPGVNVAGGFAIYLYPPPFALAFVPFAVLPDQVGIALWVGLLLAAFVAAVALMPIPSRARWLLLLVGGLSWPLVYSIKLGQVGPILLLLFVLGWRWLDRPLELAGTVAIGTMVKIQPGLHLAWALLTGRWKTAAIGTIVILIASLVASFVLGFGVWADYIALLRRVGSSPITTPHNFTPGAVAFQVGLPAETAALLQGVVMVGTVIVVLLSVARADAAASFVTTAVASQLLSPVLWDHYAALLILPVGLLLGRGHWWAAAIPLLLWLPGWAYPVLFVVGLVAPVVVGWRGPEAEPTGPRRPS